MPELRLDKIPGSKEFVQKCRPVFWFNTKYPLVRNYLSRAPHCLQRDFIPVLIEQVRLTFAAELNHPILPCSVDQKAARLKSKLYRNAAWPVCQHVQERVIFHYNISPQKDGPGRRWHKAKQSNYPHGDRWITSSLLAMTAEKSGLSAISSPCWDPSSRWYPASSSRTRCSHRTAFPCRDRSAPVRSPSSSAPRRSSPAPWWW